MTLKVYESKKKRIEWVDMSKGIGILFVIYGHCYLERKYYYWIYSFHMALFFSFQDIHLMLD